MVSPRWPVFIALALLIAITIAFVILFVVASEDTGQTAATPPAADLYAERAADLLAQGDPQRGAELVVQYSCVACHVAGANLGIAPPFAGLADRAATRRPPLSAASYVYESITNPTAFVVEGYTGAMPENFAERLSDRDLGDIMAYLLQ